MYNISKCVFRLMIDFALTNNSARFIVYDPIPMTTMPYYYRTHSSIIEGQNCVATVNGVCFINVNKAAEQVSNEGGTLVIIQDVLLSFTLSIKYRPSNTTTRCVQRVCA